LPLGSFRQNNVAVTACHWVRLVIAAPPVGWNGKPPSLPLGSFRN
jgi:hypothetical protein